MILQMKFIGNDSQHSIWAPDRCDGLTSFIPKNIHSCDYNNNNNNNKINKSVNINEMG